MATQILPVANTVGASAEFSLPSDTLVWVHGANGSDVLIGLDIKGSDGVFSFLTTMVADAATRSGVLPAGDYKATRIRGTCGFQRS